MRILFDNIVFDLQKSGGISIVWYELLKRLQHENGAECLYVDNHASQNPFRNLLNIDNRNILKGDAFIPLTRYLSVTIK